MQRPRIVLKVRAQQQHLIAAPRPHHFGLHSTSSMCVSNPIPTFCSWLQELLQQLGCVGVMSEAQADVIMDRYRNKDAVVFAALDVYKNENDMSELVDTLKRLT